MTMSRLSPYSSSRSLSSTIDWWLIACYLVLVIIGWVNIYASIYADDEASLFSWACRSGKQFVWILSSLGIATVLLFIVPPRVYEPVAPFLYGMTLLLLIAVIFLGASINGSHSWFKLGPISFQPAELSKITTSLLLASILSRNAFRMKGRAMWITFAIILVPMLTIVLEKETGTALVYVGFIFMLYREGLSGWFIGMVGLAILLFILTLTVSPFAGIIVLLAIISIIDAVINGKLLLWLPIGIPLIVGSFFVPEAWQLVVAASLAGVYTAYSIWRALRGVRQQFRWITLSAIVAGLLLVISTQFIFNNVLKEYQRDRIEILLGMKEDLSGAGYNVYESKIAIGSGGFWGKGFLNGTQTAYGFVPEQSTDFIFCTIGEQWGFFGCFWVIFLYCFLMIRIIRDSERSREAFTRIYGYCVAGIIFMHVFINIGMTLGLMPVIGIPLPFLSYGGSSMWGFTTMLFIFVALYRNEKKYF